jgi:hypothetical protein
MVHLQTDIMINRIETCLIMVIGEISIGSYNCNGLADNKKRQSVEKRRDLISQETHSTDLSFVEKGFGGEIYFSNGQRNSTGVMILINTNFDPNVQIVQTDPQGGGMI